MVFTSLNTRQQSNLTQPHPRLPLVLQAANHANLVAPLTWVFPTYPRTSPEQAKSCLPSVILSIALDPYATLIVRLLLLKRTSSYMTKGDHQYSRDEGKGTGLASYAYNSPLRHRNSPPYQIARTTQIYKRTALMI